MVFGETFRMPALAVFQEAGEFLIVLALFVFLIESLSGRRHRRMVGGAQCALAC